MRLIFVTPLLLVSVTAAHTQRTTSPQQTAPDAGQPSLQITSRLTVVDVTATDSKGRPVHGLTQSDFIIKEDGQTQAIKNFQEYAAEMPQGQALSAGTLPNNEGNTEPSTSGAFNVLLFDDVATGTTKGLSPAPEYLAYAREEAIRYLRTMPAGTHVAIMELADGLRLVQDFTSDRAELLAAVNSIRYKLVPNVNSPSPSLEEVCRAMNAQSELTVNALEQAAAFLSKTEGRKILIWFTPGIAWLTEYGDWNRFFPCLRDYSSGLQRTYGQFSEANVSLYPMDSRGLDTCEGTAKEFRGSVIGGESCMDSLLKDQASLKGIAKATGGTAYYNENDLARTIGEVIATGTDYYSVSYVPPRSRYDGQYHRIDVTVNRRGIRLQYRAGYIAVDPSKGSKIPEAKLSSNDPPMPFD